MDISDALKKNLIDFYPDTEDLLLFGFKLKDIDNKRFGYKDVNAIIFEVFEKLTSSKNKQLREVAFTVYLGDYNGFYWIGVRNNIRQKISELFSAKFEKLYDGHRYFTTTYGRYPNIPLVAKYKYNKGEIIEYVGEEMLGQTRIDTNKWYGSELKVVFKQIFPSSFGNIGLRSK